MQGPWERYGGQSPQAPASQPALPTVLEGPPRPPPAPPGQTPDQAALVAQQLRAAELENQRREREANQVTGGMTQEQRGAARSRLTDLRLLRTQLDDVERLYQENLQGPNPLEYLPSQDNARFNAAGQAIALLGRRAFRTPGSGADSDRELAMLLDSLVPTSGSFDAANEQKMAQLRRMIDEAERDISASLGTAPAEPATPTPNPAQPGIDRSARPVTSNVAQPGMALSGGDVEAQPANPLTQQAQARMSDMLKSGASDAQIAEYARSLGLSGASVVQALEFRRSPEWRIWRQQRPNDVYPFRDEGRNVEMGALSGAVAGAAASPAGTFLAQAGNAGVAGTLPLVADALGDGEQFRLGLAAQREANPGSALAGNIVGGAGAHAVGGRILGNVGRNIMSSPAARAITGDAIYGGLYGTGENHDPLSGVLEGAAGGVAGRAAARGLASTVSPTGGDLAGLYAQGVRPSVGQRFQDTNSIGDAVNLIEEGSQSLPIVGSLPRATRQRARDQWERGAWDQALGNLTDGEGNPIRLARNTNLGPQAHREAQQAFDDAYDSVRSRLTFQADADWANDLTQIRADADLLAAPVRRRFNRILEDAIDNRLAPRGGVLNGEAFKAAASDLGSEIRRLNNLRNPTQSQRELLGTLEELDSALHNGARRSSAPEVVEELSRIDRGYAMLTRIEEASRRRAGTRGRFTPSDILQVEARNGGARGRRFSAGDGLFSDYADQGRRLEDVLPSSGTSERQQIMGTLATLGTAGAAGTGAYALGADPTTIAGAGSIPLLMNLPGVRRGITSSMAPRDGVLGAVGNYMRDGEIIPDIPVLRAMRGSTIPEWLGRIGGVGTAYGIDRN